MASIALHDGKRKTVWQVESGDRGSCLWTGAEMVACKGELRQYWRYLADPPELPVGYENETIWHASWKSPILDDRLEVTFERDGVVHRADILGTNNQVIEIQRNPLTLFDVRERASFYRRELGQDNPDYRLVWVVNLNDIWQKTFKPLTKRVDGTKNQFEVEWARKREWVNEMAVSKQHRLFIDFNPTNDKLIQMWGHEGNLKASYVSKARFFAQYMDDVAKPEYRGFTELARQTLVKPRKSSAPRAERS